MHIVMESQTYHFCVSETLEAWDTYVWWMNESMQHGVGMHRSYLADVRFERQCIGLAATNRK